MNKSFHRAIAFLLFAFFTQFASADVSGSWAFAVSLGDLGSGNAEITMAQQADGKLTGTYSGQLANGPVSGTYEGDKFEFSFVSDALGGAIIYRGDLQADGTVKGAVVVQGQEIGSFTGTKK